MAKKAVVDKEKCIGCGSCVAVSQRSFKMDSDGKSVAIEPAGDDEATIQSAIDSCPVIAVSWKEG